MIFRRPPKPKAVDPTPELMAEEALEEAMMLLAAERGQPLDIWHPAFGWILRAGLPTETTADFIRMARLKRGETEK